jgi:hypothetical protein
MFPSSNPNSTIRFAGRSLSPVEKDNRAIDGKLPKGFYFYI